MELMGDKLMVSQSLNNIGLFYQSQSDFDNAIDYHLRSIEVAKEINAKSELVDAYMAIAETYGLKKNYQKAYEYQQLYSHERDNLLNEESSKQVAAMEAKYQNEKNEKEITILTNENEVKELEMSKQKTQRNALVGGLLFILAVAFLLYNRYRVKQRANKLLKLQKNEIEKQNTELEEHRRNLTEKNKNITDSINYAMRIQASIMPSEAKFKKMLQDSFIFYKPKDIVSGDFYWVEQVNELILFAAVDCTGHGVPGALVSVVGMNLLNQAVLEKGITNPAHILQHLDQGVHHTLSQHGSTDGMDLALCSINLNTNELQYAGAHNPIYYVRNGKLIEHKGDNIFIGNNFEEKNKAFTSHSIQLEKGDCLYLFSDGYADQFGGPKGKKFKYKALQKLLLSIQEKPMQQQKEILNSALAEWQGDLEQVDDICVIGVRI